MNLPLDSAIYVETNTSGMKNRFLHPDAFIAQLKSIEKQISQNQLQDAARQLNHLTVTAPHDPRLFLLGSRLAEAAHNPEGMLKAARKAHQLAPQWPTALVYLAGVLSQFEAFEEALALVTQAVQHAATQGTLDVELLSEASAVAQRAAQHPQALAWLRQAEQMSPTDTGVQYKIGLTLSAMGDFSHAVDIFTALLLQLPGNSSILIARRQSALGAQQLELAVQDGEALLAMDPDNEEHQYYLAIARGDTPPTQPASVVSLLFNGLANQFDREQMVRLRYQLPSDVALMIHRWHPDGKGDVLDLGCGTGLLGVFLGRTEGVLVGVDLSKSMIEQASRRGIYDSFHQVNVLDALQATPENQYHLITALDVLSYVGKLDTVVPNALRILMSGGRFVFSCEAGAEGEADYVLRRSTYRYAHQRGYVQRLLEDAGYKDIEINDCILRYESDQPIQGFLVIAVKQ